MSRCLPFPPPGYVRNGSSGEALIESIKLQNEKAKKERKKEKRREKKAKRKELKVQEGTFSHTSDGTEFKLIELEKVKREKSSGCLQKGDDNENVQLERSDITEEHDNSVATVGPFSSDSTQNSSKRKRSTSPCSHDHGAMVKIRYSIRKHIEPEESKLEDRLGSSSKNVGTVDPFAQDANGRYHQLRCVTNAERDQCPGNSYSRHCEELQRSLDGADPKTNMIEDESSRILSVYNSLFQNWVPPPLMCDGFKSMDQDWLLSSELQNERPVSKKAKHMNGALRCSSPSLWPRAQYLPEIELYALPYAVPF
ncbi:uncharacterized protein LOC133315635 [Gastrolobium bilobum]|uniref:uncharacterized protein LOC133315635 n=1 Tax=Gastrolobium bilobum TaxID=150636 RepID=UPI002AB13320|nr:uncharacterized protein LOC133315635 [Gastrolobium bilobum]